MLEIHFEVEQNFIFHFYYRFKKEKIISFSVIEVQKMMIENSLSNEVSFFFFFLINRKNGGHSLTELQNGYLVGVLFFNL